MFRWLQNTSRSFSFIDDIRNASQPSGLSGSAKFQSGTFPTRKHSWSPSVRFHSFQCRASQLHRWDHYSFSYLEQLINFNLENYSICCTGQKYGLLEIKIVLANLLRQFRFSVADPSKPMLVPSSEVVLKPKNGVPLIVTKLTGN